MSNGLAPGDLIVAKGRAIRAHGDRISPVEETDSGHAAAITE